MKRNAQGFTVIELMVAIAILAILMSLAVADNAWLRSSRQSSYTNQLQTSLLYAKSEAMRLGNRVTLCKSAAPTAVTPVCSTTGSWADGWILFSDNTHLTSNVAGTIDGTDTVLKVGEPLKDSTVTVGANYTNWVSFLPSGLARGNGGTASATFTICIPNRTQGSAISVNIVGRVQTSSTTCS